MEKAISLDSILIIEGKLLFIFSLFSNTNFKMLSLRQYALFYVETLKGFTGLLLIGVLNCIAMFFSHSVSINVCFDY